MKVRLHAPMIARTKGQWLQMKTTRVALAPEATASTATSPCVSGSYSCAWMCAKVSLVTYPGCSHMFWDPW